MTSNSPFVPDAVCSKALVANSDTHKIASSLTGQSSSARPTKRLACATCSWRPGNTRRLARTKLRPRLRQDGAQEARLPGQMFIVQRSSTQQEQSITRRYHWTG